MAKGKNSTEEFSAKTGLPERLCPWPPIRPNRLEKQAEFSRLLARGFRGQKFS
jgi:hypothetical protein